MFADGNLVGDGSWELRVLVTDLRDEEARTLRVKGDTHIGGVMLQLVEDLGISMDWSDHALWWPDRNCWLTRTRFTLDQYGVQADALLYFTPCHKMLNVQLPDRRTLQCKVDFSIKTFNSVVTLCKDLGIRHPEELSLCRPLAPEHLKQNYTQMKSRKISHAEEVRRGRSPLPPDTNTFIPSSQSNGSMYSRHNHSTGSSSSSGSSANGGYGEKFLCAPVRSPAKTTPVSSPLGSGGSGGGWSSNHASPFNTMNGSSSYSPTPAVYNNGNGIHDIEPDFLAMSPPPVPQDQRTKMLRPKNLVERARMNVAWLDSSLSIMEQGVREYDTLFLRFKFYSFYDLNPKYDAVRINQLYEQARWQLLNEEIDCTEEEMLMFAALQGKYGIKLEIPGPDGMSKYLIRCDSEEQYAKWRAACKLGSKGKTLADSSYEQEVKTIKTFLAMQHRAPTPAINPSSFEITPQDYVAPRLCSSKLTQRILEAHANVKDCNLVEAKMNYIKAWQSLPDFGLTLFVVRFSGSRKDELLGVAFNRIMKMDLHTGDHIKTWRYNAMKAWNVNWEVKMMMIQLDDENISFGCLSADCKVVHEFIGGYIFLSLRSKDASQTLNEELFHKLTGGWS